MQDVTRTPGFVFERLRKGNERVAALSTTGRKVNGDRPEAVRKVSAVVVACSDMCETPEALFGCEPGELIVIRVAGNIVDGVVTGSVALASKMHECPLVVILGHERCDAIGIAVSSDKKLLREPSSVIKMMEWVRERIDVASDLSLAVRTNVRAGVREISEDSHIADRLAGGSLWVIPAVYRHETGRIEWMEP